MTRTALLIALCAAPLLAEAAPADPKQAYIDSTFTAMDKNKDGRISKEEAIVVPEIAKYFAGLDTDGDGYLSLKEMQQAMVAAQTADAPTK
jgi:Ca2+-binding EF-hand superfamily protein